ncbi:MAG: beta-ketoacyl-[acyl-carrier-protein] synthase family protein [Candidatus Omnitrophota bacterium]
MIRKRRRIVITGLGVVSPIGTGKEKFWKALINGKNGVRKAQKINTDLYDTHMVAEVKDFRPEKFINFKKISLPTLTTQYALAAIQMAIDDAYFSIGSCNRVGVVLGANTADPLATARGTIYWSKHGYAATPKAIYDNLYTNVHVVKCSRYFRLQGPSVFIPAACAAGNTAIIQAAEFIKAGIVDAMFAGGCDPMNHFAFGGFNKMRAMAPKYCQPFDRDRKGMIVGEGAGVVLLENRDNAIKRKAHIYGEVLGYGLACDAYSAAMPHPDGIGGIIATKSALKMAKLKPKMIDYINAHGTGTITNDRMESKIVDKLFKKQGNNVLVSSIKSMVGHCMGAASAIEACASAMILERDIIPPNINYKLSDPSCNINIVKNKAIKKKICYMISNSFAFGGSAAVIVFSKYQG